jgi:penicillin G amidase
MDAVAMLLRTLLGRRLPLTDGAVRHAGVEGPVSIRRDRFGIPHIEAATEADAWFGLGFCQGQDRAFQIEMLLRMVRGRVSELAGPPTVALDRLSRRIGFKRAAQEMEHRVDDEERLAVESFVAGVNAGIARGLPRLPHEFVLLRTRPTPLEATDVMGLLLIQAFALASNWDSEMARLAVLRADGPDAVRDLDPAYPEWQPVTTAPSIPAGPALDALADDLRRFREVVGPAGGSNNWAIAPSRTRTGRPLLSNDPHLGGVLPPHWYLAHVSGPGWSLAGATFAGTPGFAAAHNGHAAWGITAGLVDNTDLFLEEIGPDGRSVRSGDGFVACEIHRETIEVRGAHSIVEEVLVTPRGPVIGPALQGDPGAVSMAATWLRPERVTSLFDIRTATTFEEFRAAISDWHGPPLNFAYADTSGTIGWQLAGQAPRRRAGHGTLPLPGWDPEVGWEDEAVPFADMPHLSDPVDGYVATANNRPTRFDDVPFLGVDWIDGYRVTRIAEVLAGREDWDVAGSMRLQMDVTSLPWRELREEVLGIGIRGSSAAVYQLLDAWDGVMAADSPAAAVFELFLAEMERRVAFARAPRSATAALGITFSPPALVPNGMFAFRRTGHLVRLVRERPDGWFERTWPEEMADALAVVDSEVRNRFGNDPDAWAWGRVRPLELKHPLGERPPLHRVFNRGPFPWGGDTNTVAQCGAPPLDATGPAGAIASLRMTIDVGDWEHSRFCLPGGQSGNPFSPHYDDLLEVWKSGAGVPIAWGADPVRRATVATLHLLAG